MPGCQSPSYTIFRFRQETSPFIGDCRDRNNLDEFGLARVLAQCTPRRLGRLVGGCRMYPPVRILALLSEQCWDLEKLLLRHLECRAAELLGKMVREWFEDGVIHETGVASSGPAAAPSSHRGDIRSPYRRPYQHRLALGVNEQLCRVMTNGKDHGTWLRRFCTCNKNRQDHRNYAAHVV